jgi:8-oxo-dGTP pyrophosphatase MutT (NUDIX family)
VKALFAARQAVESTGGVLTSESWAGIKEFYRFISSELRPSDLPILISSEFDSGEFLACVDPGGDKVMTPASLVTDFTQFLEANPAFNSWFIIGRHIGFDQPFLLPARWLCHLLGLRHGTAHLILFVSNPSGRLLLQVRSMRKNTSPGCYDLPVAGHVDGLQSYEDTLRKETFEEIGLDIDRLTDLRCLGGYLDCDKENEIVFNNCEYHRVFSASIKTNLIPGLVPLPGEVATLAVFPPDEIRTMRRAFPVIFAPGIQQTFDRFLPNL